MKQARNTLFAIMLSLFALPAALTAQTIYAGGGPTFPIGEYGDEDKTAAETGWVAVAGALFDIGVDHLMVGAEGFFGQNNHSDGNEKTNPYGAMALLEYGFGGDDDGDNSIGFYVFGGAGVLVHKYTNDDDPEQSESNTKFGFQAGAGVDVPLGEALGLFAEGRIMGAEETTFLGLLGGVSLGLGNN